MMNKMSMRMLRRRSSISSATCRFLLALVVALFFPDHIAVVVVAQQDNQYGPVLCETGRVCTKSNPPMCSQEGVSECNGNERNCVAGGQVVDCELPMNICVNKEKYCGPRFACDAESDECMPVNCQILQKSKCPASLAEGTCADDGTATDCPDSFTCNVLGNGKITAGECTAEEEAEAEGDGDNVAQNGATDASGGGSYGVATLASFIWCSVAAISGVALL